MNITRTLALIATVAGLTSVAQAADLPSKAKYSPVATSTWSQWMVRVRGIAVIPRDHATVDAPTRVAGGSLDLSNSVVPEVDFTYFFTKNIAAELILATTPHTIKGKGTLAGTQIGRTWLLPPTLTLQYHFTDFGAFKPYVGAGVNYTMFYNNKDKGTFTNLNLDNRFGYALQAGFDYMIDQHWGINFDVKKVFLKTTATGFLGGTPVRAKVDIDPWIVGAGVTYRF